MQPPKKFPGPSSSEVHLDEADQALVTAMGNPLQSHDPMRSAMIAGNAAELSFRSRVMEAMQRDRHSRWRVLKVARTDTEGIDETDPSRQDYVAHQLIGKGGFGEIWESRQASLGRLVALKYLRREIFEERKDDPEKGEALDQSFRQEALATANLEHPNIVPVHEVGVDQDGRPLIAMKLVRGQCWQDILDHDFYALPFSEYLSKHLPVLIDVAQAVAFAHSRGVIHRDIKPAQVMVGEFGEVVLMDWGLAVMVDPERFASHNPIGRELGLPTLKSATNPAGTLAYMAPEQTQKTAEMLGTHTDIYLLGGLLYYVLTGQTPHDPDSVVTAFRQARVGEYRPLLASRRGSEISHTLMLIMARALAADPLDRQENAQEFITDIRDYLHGAGRRDESLLITDQVRVDLERGILGYGEFNKALGDIAHARVLHRDNPDADELEETGRIRYARLAMQNGDHVLAKLQCSGITNGEKREEILRQVHIGEERIRLRDFQQRLLHGLALMLFFVMIWLGQATLRVADAREFITTRTFELRDQETRIRTLSNGLKIAAGLGANETIRPRAQVSLRGENAASFARAINGTLPDGQAGLLPTVDALLRLSVWGPKDAQFRANKTTTTAKVTQSVRSLRQSLTSPPPDGWRIAENDYRIPVVPFGVAIDELHRSLEDLVQAISEEHGLEMSRQAAVIRRARLATYIVGVLFFLILLQIYLVPRESKKALAKN